MSSHPSTCTCRTCGQGVDLEALVRAGKISGLQMTNGVLRPELFLMPKETLIAMDSFETTATYVDMEEMGIAELPYSVVDIGIPGEFITSIEYEGNDIQGFTISLPMYNPGEPEHEMATLTTKEIVAKFGDRYKDFELRFRYLNNKPIGSWIRFPDGTWTDMGHWSPEQVRDGKDRAAWAVSKVLMVLLATKNVVKTRTKDKLLSMGIGKKKHNMRPLYTTTLTLPQPEHMASDGPHIPGTSPRAHLRRGHIRRQKYGPSLQFVKRIWIEPVFVNAAEDFVSSRTAYNTSLRRQTEI